MRVYHDWEFLETGNSVYPISVGMVREDGEELYYEFIDAPWNQVLRHDWLPDNVIPYLSKDFNTALVTGEGNAVVKSRLAIKLKVYDFLADAYEVDGSLQLWGWYSSYDHVCLGQLFGAMVGLPHFIPMWTNDMRQEVQRLGNPFIPDQRKPGENAHNALDDARAEMRMHQWLMQYERGGKLRDRENMRGIQYGNGNSQINTFS